MIRRSPLEKVKGNLELFKYFERQAKPDCKDNIREISKLYQEVKIANNITAYNFIQKLASNNKNELKGADRLYDETIKKYDQQEPTSRKWLREKTKPDEPLIKITVIEKTLIS